MGDHCAHCWSQEIYVYSYGAHGQDLCQPCFGEHAFSTMAAKPRPDPGPSKREIDQAVQSILTTVQKEKS